MEKLLLWGYDIAVYAQWDSNANKIAILCPGKLDTWSYAHMRSHTKFFWELWRYALSFDPVWTWKSGGDISEYCMSSYLQTISDIIDHYDKEHAMVIWHSRWWSMAILAWTTLDRVDAYWTIMWWWTRNPEIIWFKDTIEWKKSWFYTERRDPPPWWWAKTISYDLPYTFYEDEVQYKMETKLISCKKPKFFLAWNLDTLQPRDVLYAWFELSSEPKKRYEIQSWHDYRLDHVMIQEVENCLADFVTSLHF